MSKGGSDNVTTQTKLPSWLDSAAQSTLKFGREVANRPFEQYTGQRVANTTPYQQQAYDFTAANLGQGGTNIRNFMNGMAGNVNFTPDMVTAGQFAGTNMDPYMNPYTQNVIDTTMGDIERQRQMQIAQNQGAATQAGAYGGSRHGVVDSLTNEAAQRTGANMAAQLRSAGYDQAANLAMGDISNRLQAGLANQQAGIQGAGVQNEAGRIGGLLGQAAQEADIQSAAALEQAGNAQQNQKQNQLNAQQQVWNEKWNYPYQQLNTMLSALGGTPYGGTTVQSGGSSSPLLSGLGGAAAGAGIASALSLSNPYSAGLAGLGGILGLLG